MRRETATCWRAGRPRVAGCQHDLRGSPAGARAAAAPCPLAAVAPQPLPDPGPVWFRDRRERPRCSSFGGRYVGGSARLSAAPKPGTSGRDARQDSTARPTRLPAPPTRTARPTGNGTPRHSSWARATVPGGSAPPCANRRRTAAHGTPSATPSPRRTITAASARLWHDDQFRGARGTYNATVRGDRMAYTLPDDVDQRPVAIDGAGTLGRRIAAVYVAGGSDVRIFDMSAEQRAAATDYVDEHVAEMQQTLALRPAAPRAVEAPDDLGARSQEPGWSSRPSPSGSTSRSTVFEDLDRLAAPDAILVQQLLVAPDQQGHREGRAPRAGAQHPLPDAPGAQFGRADVVRQDRSPASSTR